MLAFTDKNSDNLINEPVLNEDEDDLIYETEDPLIKAYMAGVCLVKIWWRIKVPMKMMMLSMTNNEHQMRIVFR